MQKYSFAILLAVLLSIHALSAQVVKPSAAQQQWKEAEIGVVFHYDLHVFDGKRYQQGPNRIEPIVDYNIFNPSRLNTDQWVEAAKAAGAKFALITATHETGFGIWQSDVNPYCLKALRWRDGKGDIIGDFVKSCHKYGLLPGIYIGIRWNSLLGIHNFKAEGEGTFAKNRQEWYRHYCERMVEELCSRYGKLFMIWFDGGADNPRGDGPDVEPIVNRLQPECLFYHNEDRADVRWAGSESGIVDYPCWSTFPYPYSHSNRVLPEGEHNKLLIHGDMNGKHYMPAMADFPLRSTGGRHEWFWEPNDDDAVLSLPGLMKRYEEGVGHNATLLVGLTPDTSGLIPAGDVKRLAEWGKEIALRYGQPITSTAGNKKELKLTLQKAQPITACIVQEDDALGERVRSFSVEARVDGHWQKIAEGSCIGHKFIARFKPVQASALRLRITQCIGNPAIKDFSVYK